MRTQQKCFLILSLFFIEIIFSSCSDIILKQYTPDSIISDLIWCGSKESEIVLALSEINSVYRSQDKGFSWSQINEILHSSTLKDEAESNNEKKGKVSKILKSPIDNSLLIFLGTHGINWISHDCGITFKSLNHGRKFHDYHFHPSEREWGLASSFTECEELEENCSIFQELFLTKDLGINWQLISTYVVQFAWAGLDQTHLSKGVPKERILITHEPKGTGHQQTKDWNYKVDLVYSDDFFQTSKVLIYKGNKFMLTPHYLFVAQVVDEDIKETKLMVSNSWSENYFFHELDINHNNFREHGYNFLDTSDGNVFLHINHFGIKSVFGHIYSSDYTGIKYSLSLFYNVRDKNGDCEFEKIKNLESVYIANSFDHKTVDEVMSEIQNDNDGIAEQITEKTNKFESKAKSTEHLYKYIKTNISFNKGGKWSYLIPPTSDSLGKTYKCGSECYLHLAGSSSQFPTIHSIKSAIGLIIGNGNVGSYLTNDESKISTFLSRDAGLTWFEIKKGPHLYEFGNHGGLILIAEYGVYTKIISYSWDEGLNWNELIISEEKLLITDIIPDPNTTSLKFIIHGETKISKGIKTGFLISLDFTRINIPTCKNPDEPDSVNSDYEKWNPKDHSGTHPCLNGVKMTFIRRKREIQCFNPQDWERKVFNEYCECTEDDYECDKGYYRMSRSEECLPLSKSEEVERNKPPEVCYGSYEVTRGYRKIPSNNCIGGLRNDPIIVPCSYTMFSLIAVLIFIVLIGILIFLIFKTEDSNLEDNNYQERKVNANKFTREKDGNILIFQEHDNVLFDENDEINKNSNNEKNQK